MVTAFETYLKVIFRFLVKNRAAEKAKALTKTAKGNVFQNIKRGRELFGEIGEDPYTSLDPDDLEFLGRNIQKRHVVGHNLGMSDEAYWEAAKTEQPGQTVQLLSNEILRFAEVCKTVILELEEKCPEFLPPHTDKPSSQ